jgi:hypothetical protein
VGSEVYPIILVGRAVVVGSWKGIKMQQRKRLSSLLLLKSECSSK